MDAPTTIAKAEHTTNTKLTLASFDTCTLEDDDWIGRDSSSVQPGPLASNMFSVVMRNMMLIP
jgi:hypothetical protein